MSLAERWPGGSWPRYIAAWWIPVTTVTLLAGLLYGYRRTARRRIPPAGPVIVVANHGSHLDPPLVGCLMGSRSTAILARQSLFDVPVLGPLIRFLGAIPINRDRGSPKALRSAEETLTQGRCVLMFPEGTRSPDGSIRAFRPGFLFLVRRTGATILPCAIHGAFDVWPRGRRPRLRGRVITRVGRPVSAETLAGLSDDDALALVRGRVVRLHATLDRWSKQRPRGGHRGRVRSLGTDR